MPAQTKASRSTASMRVFMRTSLRCRQVSPFWRTHITHTNSTLCKEEKRTEKSLVVVNDLIRDSETHPKLNQLQDHFCLPFLAANVQRSPPILVRGDKAWISKTKHAQMCQTITPTLSLHSRAPGCTKRSANSQFLLTQASRSPL